MYGGKYCSSSYDSDSSDDSEGTDQDYDSFNQSDPTSKKPVNRGRWTKDEDDTLRRIIEKYGCDDWKYISSFYHDRSEMQCYHRWQKALNPDLIKGPWTKEEDEKVTQLVQQYGPKRWSLISKFLSGRTGKQCRERWHNHLNPEIKKSAWTQEEDRIIYAAHKRLGNRWAEIAKRLPGRTDNAIKNHWNSTMRRKVENENPYTPVKSHPLHGQIHYTFSESDTSSIDDPGCAHSQTMRKRNHGSPPWASPPHSLTNHSRESNSMFWIAHDEEEVTTPLRNLSDLSDPSRPLDLDASVSDLTDFDEFLGNENEPSTVMPRGSTGYHFDSRAIHELSKGSSGSLIPITSPITSKFSTPPTILRKSRPKLRSRRMLDGSSTTPKGTPIKSLPFSPSQFLNMDKFNQSASPQVLTSTPVLKSHHIASTTHTAGTPVSRLFRTPNNAKRSLLESTPRTPTPLKDALEALEKRSGTNRHMCTPGQLDDITEIIHRDFGLEHVSSGMSDSQAKRVRKSLTHELAREDELSSSHFADDEQSHSLLSDSILMSPPGHSFIRRATSFNTAFLHHSPHAECQSAGRSTHETPFKPPVGLDKAWERIACGKSEDQVYMTEQAHMILHSCRPRSLKL